MRDVRASTCTRRPSSLACGERGKVVTEVRTFATTTIGLLALTDWLEGLQCTDVAMEATGVYWKPVWHVLEERFQLLLANPAHNKNVPGRKTDVKDADPHRQRGREVQPAGLSGVGLDEGAGRILSHIA